MLRGRLSQYFSDVGGLPLPPSGVSEEGAPDTSTATEAHPAPELARLQLPPILTRTSNWRFFIDGVQRTCATRLVQVQNIQVPMHMCHLIAGAMRRDDRGKLEPALYREAVVLLCPFQALQALGWTHQPPQGRELGFGGRIYEAIQSDEVLYSDTSVLLEMTQAGRPRITLQAGDLVRTGEVRQQALNRAKTLLRVMELGVLWEVRQRWGDEWILLDGPIAPLLKYARLVVPALTGLQDIANPSQAFDFLKRIVGAVKNVEIIPQQGLEAALLPAGDLVVPVYRFGDFVKDEDAVAREILCAFVWLRRELSREISVLWSPVSGLARLDVPLPALLDDSLRAQWNTLDDNQLNLAAPTSPEWQKLESILMNVVVERWPVPQATLPRMLTEFYPVEETERWLSSMLRSPYELSSVM